MGHGRSGLSIVEILMRLYGLHFTEEGDTKQRSVLQAIPVCWNRQHPSHPASQPASQPSSIQPFLKTSLVPGQSRDSTRMNEAQPQLSPVKDSVKWTARGCWGSKHGGKSHAEVNSAPGLGESNLG